MTVGYYNANSWTQVILDDDRNPYTSWANHVARGSAGGVDLVAAMGSPLYAPADCVLVNIPNNGSGGNTAEMRFSDGWRDQYMHLSRFTGAGAKKRGDLVGWSGASGGNYAPHLHWHRIDPSGTRRNPWDYFGGSGGSGSPTGYGYGLSTEAQKALQAALTKLGLYDGAVDGEFGPKSVSAMQTYLKSKGFLPGDYTVDGEPGPLYGGALQQLAAQHGYTGPIDQVPGEKTSAGLIAWAGTVTNTSTAGGGSTTPSPDNAGYGLTAEAQMAAQAALAKLGLYTGKVDGVFGPLSVSAFQQYLKNIGLLPGDYDVDGVPGPLYGAAIQNLAAKYGYTGAIDGEPGPNTSVAIVTWGNSVVNGTTPPPATGGGTTPPAVKWPTTGSFGIDVATSQKDIDFAKAKADGVQWVIVKMGGLNVTPQYVAPNYKTQIDRARAVNLPVGHYYLIGKGQHPVEQANYFVDNLHNFDVTKDVLALDNELLDSNGTFWTQDDVAQFVVQVINRTGIDPKRVWVYAGANDWRTKGPWAAVQALGIRVWWAAYGANNGTRDHEPSLQGSVTEAAIHQFSSQTAIAGYKLDGNWSKYTVAELFATGTIDPPTEEPVNAELKALIAALDATILPFRA